MQLNSNSYQIFPSLISIDSDTNIGLPDPLLSKGHSTIAHTFQVMDNLKAIIDNTALKAILRHLKRY